MIMSRKKLATFALIMAAVFLFIILVYPMMFNPSTVTAPEGQPVVAPAAPIVNQ